jgi:hypothetical protein
MLRVLALGLLSVAFSLMLSPGPAAAACDCKYDAMCPSGYACKTNGVLCAAAPMKGTCTRIVSDVGRPKPVFSNPDRSSDGQGAPTGMTAQ